MKLRLRAPVFVACIFLALMSITVRADEVPIVTGEHWTKSTEQVKKAYLIGIANLLQIETAYEEANPRRRSPICSTVTSRIDPRVTEPRSSPTGARRSAHKNSPTSRRA